MSQPKPAPSTLDDLTFERQRMTGWFDPPQLLRTGVRAVLSATFGSYVDRRELQAALHANAAAEIEEYDYRDGVFWMDYVADLGDGFDPTYTVALALAQAKLDIPDPAGGAKPVSTRRGSVLVMGGDQVYPSATREEYRNRLYGPYEAAMPWQNRDNPHLYAVPGNHDWYDGLTSFIRQFCQERYIGGWKTVQRRSYFAAKLPGRWWLWGVDLQLQSDLDEPQLEYFRQVAARAQPGDRFIVCTPAPAWVTCGEGNEKAFEVLDFFLKNIVPSHSEVSVIVAGDLHHYSRYQNQKGDQRITSGAGGAYLYPTHNLPGDISIRRSTNAGEWTETLTRESVYPPRGTSRRLAFQVFRFLTRNRQFALLLGAIYLLFAWMIESASDFTLMERLAQTSSGLVPLLTAVAVESLQRPAIAVLALFVVAGLSAFSASGVRRRGRQLTGALSGALHGVAHLALGVVLTWQATRLLGAPSLGEPLRLLAFALIVLASGTIAGGVLMGLYLLLTNTLLKLHDNETFSSQAIPHYRNFLRFKFTADGALTIYPIAIDEVTTSWKANPDAPPEGPWIVPTSGTLAACKLAEPPIVLGGRVTAPPLVDRSASTALR